MKSAVLRALTVAIATYASATVLESRQSNWTVGQTVDTNSGPVQGHPAKNASEVSEYLGIPFGQAPVGDLRFAAPVKYRGNSTLNGTDFGFSCPILASGSTPNLTQVAFANVTAAGVAIFEVQTNSGPYSEDCLNLNVWTKPQTGEAKKAVLVWIYGGGFTSGSSATPAYTGANIANQEDVVVVSFNYRLSVLGFPGSPNGTYNVALLDQRLAVEWVRDNIANFGGDPDRITLFGQSAGGVSVDLYNYAYVDDPIAHGYIPESGTVFNWGLPNTQEEAAGAWFNTASNLGCGNSSSNPATVLSCMRSKNYTDILENIPASSGTASILGYFGPTIDDKVVFSNYSSRTPSTLPVLMGSCNYEAGLFRTEFALTGLTFSDAFWDDFNLQEFTCPAGIRANASIAAKVPTWRYRYFGDFPNTRISTEAGAWHASELPILFDTAPNSIPATTAEISIADYMRKAWTTFAKDPVNGLTNYGWPTYDPSQDTLVRLAYNNITGPNLINPQRYDADCVYVNVSSTDASADSPALPDLGSSITPTGTATSITPSSTGSGGATTTGTTTETSSPATQTANGAAGGISVSGLLAVGAFFVAWLI